MLFSRGVGSVIAFSICWVVSPGSSPETVLAEGSIPLDASVSARVKSALVFGETVPGTFQSSGFTKQSQPSEQGFLSLTIQSNPTKDKKRDIYYRGVKTLKISCVYKRTLPPNPKLPISD